MFTERGEQMFNKKAVKENSSEYGRALDEARAEYRQRLIDLCKERGLKMWETSYYDVVDMVTVEVTPGQPWNSSSGVKNPYQDLYRRLEDYYARKTVRVV